MTGNRRVRRGAAAVLAAAVVLASACAAPSDEALIRDLIEEAAARAEKRDVAGLAGLFAPDYGDFEGRDAAGTVRLVTDYLAQYRGVVVHVLGVRVDPAGPDGRVPVECEVVLSHGAAEMLRKLIRYGGESYRFRIEVRRSGPKGWRFTYAEWRAIGTADLFPESIEVLRKLFPDL